MASFARLLIGASVLLLSIVTHARHSIAFAPSTSTSGRCSVDPSRSYPSHSRCHQPTKTGRIPLVRSTLFGQMYDSPSVAASGMAPGHGKKPTSEPTTTEAGLSPLEVWCLVRIEQWYSSALNHKCPFLRRRATDLVETMESIVRTTAIRPTNIALIGPPVSCRGDERTGLRKSVALSMEQLATILRNDWREDTHKGYYITGRLTPEIYRDDCLFDGPDPDMPVRGLRKFLNAASQLFDPKESRCQLLSLEVHGDVIVARWIMNGTLRLPWLPKLPQVKGTTVYHFDVDRLVQRHEETWDLSVIEAFLKTSWFDFRRMAAHSHT
jgi:Uncharacterized conserved protein (DUF2358)